MRRRRAALLIRREPKSSDARSATHVSQLPARQAREAAGLSHVASVFASTTERGALDRPSKDQSSCPREAAGDGMSARKSPAERAKRRQCLVFGLFGKRLVKVYGLCAGSLNLRRGVANLARWAE